MAAKMLLLAVVMFAQSGKAALVVQQQGAIALEDRRHRQALQAIALEDKDGDAPMYDNNIPTAAPYKVADLGDMPQPPKSFGHPGAWWKDTGLAEKKIRPTKAKNGQITLIINMIQKVKYASQVDLFKAHKAYDRAACTCQDQLATATESLGENKEIIAKHRDLVKKYSAEIGALKASTKQLTKDIKEMKVALKENDATRKTESAAYVKNKFNLDENIKSMAAALVILGGPATTTAAPQMAEQGKVFAQEPADGGVSFLSLALTTQLELETQLAQQDRMMQVVSQVEPIVTQGTLPSGMQPEDVEVLKSFLGAPGKFLSDGTGTSELQVDATGNPSAQIDGIMKAMLDGFQADLKKAVSEETDSLQSYESLKLSKSSEKFTFEQELQRSSGTLADKTKDSATSKTLLDETAKSDAADKEFFQTTKDACKEKAKMWSRSSRLRTEEIAGLDRAMYQLGADYVSSGIAAHEVMHTVLPPPPPPPPLPMLLQEHMYVQRRKAARVFSSLKALALKSHSVHIALVAIEASQSEAGVFDKLMPKIDDMIAALRKEEQDDIKKRDYCENTLKDIANDQADLATELTRTDTKLLATGQKNTNLDTYITQVTAKISYIQNVMLFEKNERKKEHQLYKDDLADKTRAKGMMGNAVKEIEKIYKKNALLQVQEKGKPHANQQEESNTIVSMLTMMQQDIANEIKEDEEDDAGCQKTFEKKMVGLKRKQMTQEALRTEALKDKAANDVKTADLTTVKSSNTEDQTTTLTKKTGVDTECAHLLVSNGFATRRSNRKVEIQGLSDAKDVLAGGLPTL